MNKPLVFAHGPQQFGHYNSHTTSNKVYYDIISGRSRIFEKGGEEIRYVYCIGMHIICDFRFDTYHDTFF